MSRILKTAAIAILVAGACHLAVFASGPAPQFTDAVTEYYKQLNALRDRAAVVLREIGAIRIQATYCTAVERSNAGQQLEAATQSLNTLLRDFTAFQAQIRNLVARPGVLQQFEKEGLDPSSGRFWFRANQEIREHPRNDLAAKQRQFGQSKVVDCRTTEVAPPPPPKPAAPPKDPLAGLKRPAVPAVDVPPAPKPFCTEQERRAWEDSVIWPRLDALRNAAFALNSYEGELHLRLIEAGNARPPQPDAVKALQTELDWSRTAHIGLDKLYSAIQQVRDSAVIADCTKPGTPTGKPAAPPPTASPSPNKEVGANPDKRWFNQWEYWAGIGGGIGVTSFYLAKGKEEEENGGNEYPTPQSYNGTYTGQAMPVGINSCGFSGTGISGVLNVNTTGVGTWRKTHLSVSVIFDYDVTLVMNAVGATFDVTKMQTVGGLPFRVRDMGSFTGRTLTLRQRFEGLVNNVVVCEAELTMTLTRN